MNAISYDYFPISRVCTDLMSGVNAVSYDSGAIAGLV